MNNELNAYLIEHSHIFYLRVNRGPKTVVVVVYNDPARGIESYGHNFAPSSPSERVFFWGDHDPSEAFKCFGCVRVLGEIS